MPEVAQKETYSKVRSSWNESRLLVRGPLTDRKIDRYTKQGWYSAEYRQARRERMERRSPRRSGNFVQDGQRLIYSPL